MKRSLIFALSLMGFTSVVTQVLLIRELLVTFYGNELSIGLILANWLILEAVGSSFLGRIADRVKRRTEGFAVLQLIIALFLPMAIFGARIARNITGVVPGEAVGLFPILYCSSFILAPLGLSDGAQFTFGCRIYSALSKSAAPSIGRVYIYEAIGSIIGGLAFTYLFIPYFHSVQIALITASLNLLSAVLLLTSVKSLSPLTAIVALLLASTLYLLFSSRSDEIHSDSIRRQWRGYDLQHYQNSIYGNVAAAQRGGQFTFFSDGIPICTIPIPDITSVEELVHLPLLFHSSPRRILLISGGVGGVLNEILKHPVERIDYAELDPLIIEVVQKFATPLTESELNNPKVYVKYIDGRLFVRRAEDKYDVVIVNLPHPSTLQLNRFYTMEFFQAVRRILNEGGILVIGSPGSLTYMSEELGGLNACIYSTLRRVFPYLRPIPGDFNLFLASPSAEISTLDPSILIRRFRNRALETELLTDFHIGYKLDGRRLDWFLESLREGRVNEDFLPLGLFYDLSYWNALSSPSLRGAFRLIGRISLPVLLIPLGIFAFIFLVVERRTLRLRTAPIPIAIAATGFAGMSFDMVLVLAFQSLYGYVYHRIGLLITAFMVGLALGGSVMTHLMGKIKRDTVSFLKIELIIVLYSALLPIALILFHSHIDRPLVFSSVQIMLLVLSSMSGFLVGFEFPLAGKICLKSTDRVSRVAGTLYASDLFGAWIGALAVSVVLIPVLGILKVCVLVVVLKLISLVLVIASLSRPLRE